VAEDLRIRCVAFDFDGTLVDSNAVKRQAYFEAARREDPSGQLVAAVLAELPQGDRPSPARGGAAGGGGRAPDRASVEETARA
jgi:beta-phosphoglucomutase-like phosphatase (HAD superfamily)